MSYTPGYEELKSVLKGYFGDKEGDKIFNQLVKMANENNYNQFESVIKNLFEEVAKKAMEDDTNSLGWNTIANLVGVLSQKLSGDREIQQKVARLQKASLIKNAALQDAEKKKILLELLMEPKIIAYFSGHLFNYFVKMSHMQHSVSKFVDDAVFRADIAYNNLASHHSGWIGLFNILLYLFDLFCMEIGVPNSLLNGGAGVVKDQENAAEGNKKTDLSNPEKIPSPDEPGATMWRKLFGYN